MFFVICWIVWNPVSFCFPGKMLLLGIFNSNYFILPWFFFLVSRLLVYGSTITSLMSLGRTTLYCFFFRQMFQLYISFKIACWAQIVNWIINTNLVLFFSTACKISSCVSRKSYSLYTHLTESGLEKHSFPLSCYMRISGSYFPCQLLP